MRRSFTHPRLWLALGVLAWTHAPAAESFGPERAGALIAAMAPPPTDESLAGLADLQTVLQVQADRTADQVARARRVAGHTVFLMGARVFGAWFTPENLPVTARFFKTAGQQFHPVLVQAKEKWQRPRPFVRDSRVHPCLAPPEGTSYPSGHSATAAVWAELFCAAFPDKRDAFTAQVSETMWSRVLGGVHYPTDTQAGRLLGEAIGREMLAQPDTRAAIAEMRREIEMIARGQTPARAALEPAAHLQP